DAESAAHNQNQGADSNGRTGAVAAHKAFKDVVQETETAEVLRSPDVGDLVKLPAGIVKSFPIQGVHFIVADADSIQILLDPCGGIRLHESAQSLRIHIKLFHQSRILADFHKRICHEIRIQTVAVTEGVRHQDRP